MTTNCENCPLRKKPLFKDLSAEEVRFMQRFKSGELVVDPGTQILMEGANSPQLYTALNGMGIRYKMLEDGRRQVVNLVLPGDFLGLQAGLMGEMGYSVEATTRMTLCVFRRSDFWSFMANHTERAFDLTWLAAIDEHFLGETLTTVGQRTAIEAIAWAFVRVYLRAKATLSGTNGRVSFPYRQQDLADALGLSLVHTNKTVQKLRKQQLITWEDGMLTIHDLEQLAHIAKTETAEPPRRPIL